MKGDILILLPVLLPVISGILLPFLKPLRERKARNIYVVSVTILCTAAVFFVIFSDMSRLIVWDYLKDIPIYFKVDSLGKLFAGLTVCMWLVSAFYSSEYMKHEEHEVRYFSFFLLSLGALLGVCFAGNLITMYLFYEFMTMMTFPIVLHTKTKDAIAAGMKFLIYSVGGAFLALFGFFFLYQYTSTLEFTPGGVLDLTKLAGHESELSAAVFCIIIGFSCKAGMFPLHGWLPTAHPIAPAPASALLSGNVTKMGVLAIIRVVYFITGADFLRGTWVQYTWLGIALLTIFMGSMLAYKEENLKKLLAYSSVSQLSYILFGLALLSPAAMLGALMHVVFHSIIKNALFLIAGAIIYKTGKHKVKELLGIGKEMPITMWCFTIVSVALVGIPPTSAFLSKWYLASGAMASNLSVYWWLGPVILLVSALLTAGYLLTITAKAFFPGKNYYDKIQIKTEPSYQMIIPFILLAAISVIIGMFPGALINLLNRITALFF